MESAFAGTAGMQLAQFDACSITYWQSKVYWIFQW